MGARDVYERLKDGNSKAKKVYAQMQQSILQINSDLYDKTKSRYYDDEGNYIDKYRSDSKDWGNTVTSLSNSANEKSNNISSFLNKYGMYLDSDFVSKLTKGLDETKGYSSDILKQANSEYDYFSQFKDEADYNEKVIIPQQERDAMLSLDVEAEEKELELWEKDYENIEKDMEGFVSSTTHDDWRVGSSGWYEIPYSATSIPEFVGKTSSEVEQMINVSKEELPLIHGKMICDEEKIVEMAHNFGMLLKQ